MIPKNIDPSNNPQTKKQYQESANLKIFPRTMEKPYLILSLGIAPSQLR